MLAIAVLAVPALLMSLLIGMERVQVALMGGEARRPESSTAVSNRSETATSTAETAATTAVP